MNPLQDIIDDDNETYYPDIVVKLTGVDGNFFSLMGTVVIALRAAKVGYEEIQDFQNEAMNSPSYDSALGVFKRWVTVT